MSQIRNYNVETDEEGHTPFQVCLFNNRDTFVTKC